MKKSILAMLFSVGVLAVLGPPEEAEGPPLTPVPVHGTPSLNPGIPSVQPRPVTPKIIPSTDFHFPDNLHRPLEVPKYPKPIVILPQIKVEPVKVMGSTPSEGKGLNFPRDSGHMVYRPKLPGEVKATPVKVFDKNVSAALLMHPTKIEYVNTSLKKFQPQALLIKNNMLKHYVQSGSQWFTANWMHNYNSAYPYWHAFHHHKLHPPWWWWQTHDWHTCSSWVSYRWAEPFYYDCGVNVYYRDNFMYLNGVAVASAPDYAYQAFQLAGAPPPPPEQKIEYLPLGVYTLASSRGDPDPDLVLQLAITREGFISGTMFNRTTDTTVAVSGWVDPETQRVAIRLSDTGDLVMETWFYNMTLPHSCVLMHFGILDTQIWFLARMDPLPME
jgi:hypothetical protein